MKFWILIFNICTLICYYVYIFFEFMKFVWYYFSILGMQIK